MATYEYELGKVPEDLRSKELWLQHTAGLIYFEDARQFAIDKIDDSTDVPTRDKIIEGINNALYGIMMIIDGVSGQIENSEYAVNLETNVNLIRKSGEDAKIVNQISLMEGDGMCMGYHGWLEGDFGEEPVAKKKNDNT